MKKGKGKWPTGMLDLSKVLTLACLIHEGINCIRVDPGLLYPYINDCPSSIPKRDVVQPSHPCCLQSSRSVKGPCLWKVTVVSTWP